MQHGLDWIDLHAALSKSIGKPSTFTGFGVVSEDVVSDYEPFNSISAGGPSPSKRAAVTTFASVQQKQDSAATITAHAGNQNTGGISGYQESTTGLKSKKGSVVDDSNTSGSNPTEASQKGKSPNDGYAKYVSLSLCVISRLTSSRSQRLGCYEEHIQRRGCLAEREVVLASFLNFAFPASSYS